MAAFVQSDRETRGMLPAIAVFRVDLGCSYGNWLVRRGR